MGKVSNHVRKESQRTDRPPAVKSDPKARELVRVWTAHGQQHVTI
ncbi:MAG: DUF5076 domain-containing protein, partial [Gammaproteobacteria bacterium]